MADGNGWWRHCLKTPDRCQIWKKKVFWVFNMIAYSIYFQMIYNMYTFTQLQNFVKMDWTGTWHLAPDRCQILIKMVIWRILGIIFLVFQFLEECYIICIVFVHFEFWPKNAPPGWWRHPLKTARKDILIFFFDICGGDRWNFLSAIFFCKTIIFQPSVTKLVKGGQSDPPQTS